MGVILFGVVLGAVLLWSVSIGAVLEIRREHRRGLDGRCPAWVPLPQVDGELYRCGAPVRPGQQFCGAHAQPSRRDWADRHPGWRKVDRTRRYADARSKVRWGVPLAVIALAAAVTVALALR